MAALIRAGVLGARAQNDLGQDLRRGVAERGSSSPHTLLAIDALRAAEQAAEAASMRLFVHACRRARGRLLADAHGRALVDAADAWMVEQGVRAPERLAAVLLPGFSRQDRNG